jgi:DNA excision repair protein ERCC-2
MKVNTKDRNVFSNFTGLSDIKDNKQVRLELSYRCLDPALVTAEMIESSYCTIVMSGTLSPLEMYRDLMGFPEGTLLKSYKSPFSQKNRKNIIIPSVTTEYKERGDLMYRKIAEICSDIVNRVPGNSAIFFPSYKLRDDIYNHFMYACKKTTLLEEKELSKDQKRELLDTFKSYSKTGAVLLGAISGSFSEGIDLPGEFLKCVVVVGVPLSVPDLETRKLIDYYEQKFGKGREYGYTLPAMTRCLQGAGRCIRSETDRGFIAFLDKRFSWPKYKKAFPSDWEIGEENEHVTSVVEFFRDFEGSD